MLHVFAFSFAILLLFTVFLWFCYQFRYTIYLWKVPGPRRWPILGNVLQFWSTVELLPAVLKCRKKYGKLFQVTFGFQPPQVVIMDHKFLQFLLSSNHILDKALSYNYLHNWLGRGLLTSTGSLWRSHRKIIVPAFHFKILEQFVDVFNKNGKIFVKKLEDELNSSSFDIYQYVNLLSLDIICESALGTEINAQNNSQSEYVKSVKYMCKLIMDRLLNPLLQWEFIYHLTNTYQKEKKALDVLHTVTRSVIRQKKENLLKNDKVEGSGDSYGIKKKLAFLDLLLKNTEGELFSDEELQEEVDTFMFEGHDTVSSALSFAIFALSKNPEVQKKVAEELGLICNFDQNYSFTFADLQNMKYLEVVIKETLRLYPSVPIYGRTVSEDFEFEGTKYIKGTILLVVPYVMGRDEEFFSDPENFYPERFIDSSLSSQYPYSYLPFSAGPRNCIGQKFAMYEMKSTLAKFFQNYEALPAIPNHELIFSSETTLKSISGVKIRIKRRNFT